MQKYIYFSLLLLLISACQKSQKLALPANAQQVLLVLAANDTTIHGEAQLFQWENKQSRWLAQTEKMPITLGRTGLAWGRGAHAEAWMSGKMKREGDGKAPMGFFPIIRLFGYAEQKQLPFQTQMPYIQAKKGLLCIDDVNSRFYNDLVSEDQKIEHDWNSHEEMLRNDNLYELGAVIDYNVSQKAKGDGSCVFLHIWRNANAATAGCTAGDYVAMQNIFSKLSPDKKPLLVQLTQAEYDKIKGLVSLP